MKVAFALSALFTSVDANLKIVGGKEAEVGKHLYVTGIRSSASGIDSCGGSLIAPNVVLTAAHCMGHGLKYVAIGSHYNNGTEDGEQIKIKQEIKHPKYNKKTSSYDFGVYIVERDSTFPVVEVSFDTVEANTPTVVRGWGTTSSAGSPSKVLLEVGVDVVNQEQCTKWLSGHTGVDGFSVDASMLCSGGKEGEDACQGDSGGPLTVETNGSAKLVGVVSWGLKCAEKNKPGVYSRISMARDFIEPYLKNSPTSVPGPTNPTTMPNMTTMRPTTASPCTTSAPCPTKPTTSAPCPTKPTTLAPCPTKSTTMPNMTTMRPSTAYPKPGCATCSVCYYPGADYCLDDFSKDDCEYYSPKHGTLWCGN
ncbi:hypothetical protein DYB28_002800 [Aphanomyces astaci]|uniref:Peptidase S1 domain-containing protein n=1 Tax=Aphanomyces astaci TaxID=112090 RepID=A0A9X8HBK3_APHAT|nr:hypothetical protein DYB28_002800 [Aphanomyces astaci]